MAAAIGKITAAKLEQSVFPYAKIKIQANATRAFGKPTQGTG